MLALMAYNSTMVLPKPKVTIEHQQEIAPSESNPTIHALVR